MLGDLVGESIMDWTTRLLFRSRLLDNLFMLVLEAERTFSAIYDEL